MVVIGVILYIHDRLSNKPGTPQQEAEPVAEQQQDDCSDECCGTHDVCPSEMMLRHFNDPAQYYDDEELDAFKGRGASDYSDDELLPWERSIKKRGITMPGIIKEELVALALR